MEWHIYLFGYPLEHSRSPDLNNRYFRKLQLPLIYEAHPVPPARFREEVPRLMRENHFLGANVTIPYKPEIVPLLDDLRGEASTIGVANTVVRTQQGLLGYNTDALAFRETLHDAGWDHVKSAMVIGSGGGAQAAVWALAAAGCSKLVILYRSERRLKSFRKLLRRLDRRASFFPLRRTQEFFQWAEREGRLMEKSIPDDCTDILDEIARQSLASDATAASARANENEVKHFDLLVNATPVGLHPHADEVLIDHPRFFRMFRAVADLVYNPRQTKLLFLAHLAGCQTISGMKMLEAQAALSREIWLAELKHLSSRHSADPNATISG